MAFTEEEIRIVQARRAARAARAIHTAAGLPEEQKPQQKGSFAQRLALGKMLLIVLVGGLIVFAVSMLRYYGTLGPCGILSQTLHEALLRRAASKATTLAETRSREASARTLLSVVDHRIENMSPAECTRALVQFEISGETSLADWLFVQPTP